MGAFVPIGIEQARAENVITLLAILAAQKYFLPEAAVGTNASPKALRIPFVRKYLNLHIPIWLSFGYGAYELYSA